MAFKEVNQQIDFAKEEEKILGFWKENKIFEKSVDQRPLEKLYTFYDGPPFATGLPHYGHLLAGIIKDIIPRYWTMKGYHIERRFGWDCHGLPIEYEIDKTLGISGAAGVKEFGIARYNQECRSIVLRYTGEWEKTVERIGRWIDFRNDYKTMDASFMESVWWVFKQLWDKGLIYKGYRVMPYSTAVATPLSNFEATSNYKEVQDPAITVRFKVVGEDNTFFLAWTTTPWTLPSNLALAVGPELDYVKIRVIKTGEQLYLGAARVVAYFKKEDEYEILQQFKGKDLEGKKYEPLFPYFKQLIIEAPTPEGSFIGGLYDEKSLKFDFGIAGAQITISTNEEKRKVSIGGAKMTPRFSVLNAEYVTVSDGTGIVHQAPAFGEDDFNTCKKYGIELVLPVDEDGRFTKEVPDFVGRYVKDADKDIIAKLKAEGKLYRHDTINHNYPFCWRSDTPLIYRAVSAWFVNVEKIKDRLMANNKDTHWVPENLRDGRFGNWLENARDWNISRNRFWGNPLPIWENSERADEDPKKYLCFGNIAELEKFTGAKITDLHREYLDDFKVPDADGIGFYKRVPEVLDCWFESGSMPYAQNHYPFQNKELFEKGFPADFIAEGLDQTRGWFYTLSVLGTALFDKIPFKNVVVNGMLLAEDGKKMSKRLKNYPDPTYIIDTYGADALRLYMIQSPAVRAEELRFAENGVKEIVRRILLKWWNSYSFFISYATIDKWEPSVVRGDDMAVVRGNEMAVVRGVRERPLQDENILDAWIMSRLQSLLANTEKEMALYHLYNVVPALLDFIDDLTNVYIRLNRKRFWGEDNSADKQNAYNTLYTVLFTMTKVMAPFTPFLSELMFENLKGKNAQQSVHLEDFPTSEQNLIRTDLEESVAIMNRVILMVRNIREKQNIKVKIPLKRIAIVHRDSRLLDHVKTLENYLKEELNAYTVEYLTNESDFVELTAKANGASLGKRLGKKFGEVGKACQTLDHATIVKLEQGHVVNIAGEDLTKDDLLIYRKAKAGHENVVSDAFITVEVDTTLDAKQIQEGMAREVVNRIQKLRKTADLKLDDRIMVEYQAECEIDDAMKSNLAYITEQTLAVKLSPANDPQGQASEVCDIDGKKLVIALTVA